MREIRTDIDALPAAVWEVLADIESYEKWNLRITHVRGELREGGSIDIAVDRIGEKSRTMTVRVSAVQPPRRLQWIGTVDSKWVFESQHTFDVHSLADGRSRVVNRERVSGLLTRFSPRTQSRTTTE